MIPFDLSGFEFLFLVFTAACGGLLRGYSGFGSALLLSPLWAIVIGPVQAVATLMILEAVVTLQLLPRAAKSTDWKLVGWLSVGAIVAIPFGTYLLVTVDPDILRRSIGIVVLVWSLIMLMGLRYEGRLTVPMTLGIGAISGAMTGATSLGGPPVLMYLLSSPARAESNRANIITYFGLISLVLVVALLLEGIYTSATWWRGLFLTPVFMGGAWIGARAFDRTSEATFRRLVLYFLLAIGVLTVGGWDLLRAAL